MSDHCHVLCHGCNDLLAERDALRAQLAAAQRIPEDAELDAIEDELKGWCGCSLSDDYACSRCRGLHAITALRRRVVELTDLSGDHVIEVLSQPCFEFIDLARLWRDTGTEIPRKAEQEQAFFLRAQLVYAIAHGADWRQQFFVVEIEPRLAQARAAIAKEPQDA